MKKHKKLDRVEKLVKHGNCDTFKFSFDSSFYNLVPLKAGGKLFLSAHDVDFFIDGYKITPYKFIEKISGKGKKYNEIFKAEKVAEGLEIPDIDITDMRSACRYFFENKRYISAEYKSAEYGWNFVIGKIVGIGKKHFLFRHFDARGLWEDKPRKIKYSDVFIIHFGDRYTEVFSKYVEQKF